MNINIAAEVIEELLKSLKGMCEAHNRCTECPFLDDHVCLLDCEPEDYNIELLRTAVQKQLKIEIEKEGDQSGT